MKQTELIAGLKSRNSELINQAEAFRQHPTEGLNQKSSSTSWSVLECLEHVNLYGDFYLPTIESSIIEGGKKSGSKFPQWLVWYENRSRYASKKGQSEKNEHIQKQEPPKF